MSTNSKMVDHISLPLTKLIAMGKFDSLERGNLGKDPREDDERRKACTSDSAVRDEKSNVSDTPLSSVDGSARFGESGERAGIDSGDEANKLQRRRHKSYKKFPIMAPLGIGEKGNPLVKKLLSDPNSNMRRYFEMRKKGKYKDHDGSNKMEPSSGTSEIIQSSDEDISGGEVSGTIEPSIDQKNSGKLGTDSSQFISPESEKGSDVQKGNIRKNEGGKIKDDLCEVKKKQQSINIQKTPESKHPDRPNVSSTAGRKTLMLVSTGTRDIPEASSNSRSCTSKGKVLDDSFLVDDKYIQTKGTDTDSLMRAESSHSRTKKSGEKSQDTKRFRDTKVEPQLHKKKVDEIITSPSSGAHHKKGKRPSTPIYREKFGKDSFSEHASEVAQGVHKPKHSVDKHPYPRPQIRPLLLMKTSNNLENNEDNSDEAITSQRRRKSTTENNDYSGVDPNTVFSEHGEFSEPSTSSGISVRHPWDGNDEVLIREEKRRRLEALFRVTEKEMAEVSSSGSMRISSRDQEQDIRQEKRRRLITPSQILKGKEQMAEKSLQRKRLRYTHGKERTCVEHEVKLVTPSQILKGKKRSEEEKTERIESKEGTVKYHSDEDTSSECSKDNGKRRRREKKKSKKRSESKERSHKSKKGRKREKKYKEGEKYEDSKNDEDSADEISAEESFPERKFKARRSESEEEMQNEESGAHGMPGNELTGGRNPIVSKPVKSYQKKKVHDNSHLTDHDFVDDWFTIRKL